MSGLIAKVYLYRLCTGLYSVSNYFDHEHRSNNPRYILIFSADNGRKKTNCWWLLALVKLVLSQYKCTKRQGHDQNWKYHSPGVFTWPSGIQTVILSTSTVSNKLCFKSNSDVWKMSYFKVVGALVMFYKSIIGSVHIVAWFGHFYLVNKGW